MLGIEKIEEAEQHVCRRMFVHECAEPLPPHHKGFVGQRRNGLARGALAHTELRCDLEFVGNELTRPPGTRADALDRLVAEPGIKGAAAAGVAGSAAGCAHGADPLPSNCADRLGLI